MAYKQVVEMLGDRPASTLELLKKFFIDWNLDVDKLLHFFQNIKKEDLLGLLEGTHKVVRIEKGKNAMVRVLKKLSFKETITVQAQLC